MQAHEDYDMKKFTWNSTVIKIEPFCQILLIKVFQLVEIAQKKFEQVFEDLCLLFGDES